jgi:hypothetical protein
MSHLLLCNIQTTNKSFQLPIEIVDIIKTYTGEGIWRNGKFITIHKISKSDKRYEMLLKRPRIKQVRNCDRNNPLKGSTWFKTTTGKFMVINTILDCRIHIENVYYVADVWEMHYNKDVVQVVIR